MNVAQSQRKTHQALKALGLPAFDNDVPELSRLAEHIGVPFSVQPVADARILWLNERYLMRMGVDVTSPETRGAIEGFLLERFAVLSDRPTGVADYNGSGADITASLWADRYGGSFGSTHGGSGRCGILGPFNAKGIGPTPLVGRTRDGSHADGKMWLDDAVREAICAEIACAELPHGAIPVIAIIDTVITESVAGENRRRGIVVRPNFIRPAHFERSIFFGTGGHEQSAQYLDARRVEGAIRSVTRPSVPGMAPFDLRRMFKAFGEQIGVGRAHRLWQGRCLSSNLATSGALVDFGSFRAVPSWSRFIGEVDEIFGAELKDLNAAASSMAKFFSKHGPAEASVQSEALTREALSGSDKGFATGCVNGPGLGSLLDGASRFEIGDMFRDYFVSQQKLRLELGEHKSSWRRKWLYDSLSKSRRGTTGDAASDRMAARLKALCDDVAGSDRTLAAAMGVQLRRWLKPRPLLYYETAVPLAKRLVRRFKSDERDVTATARYIEASLSHSRRVFDLPGGFVQVLGVTVTAHNFAVFGRGPDATFRVFVDMPVIDDTCHLFGSRVPSAALACNITRQTKFGAMAEFALDDQNLGQPVKFGIGETVVTIPAATHIF